MLLDANVLLDVGLDRRPHVRMSEKVVLACFDSGEGAMAWHSVSLLAYFLKADAPAFIGGLLERIDVPATGRDEVRHALSLGMTDLEDALQVAAAVTHGAEAIVTRDGRDFRNSPVPALSPEAFVQKVEAS